LAPTAAKKCKECRADLQLEEGEVGVAVIRLVVALLLHIVLEDRRRLGVVSVESVEDRLDVLGALWRVVERNTHDVRLMGCKGGGWEVWRWSCSDVVYRGGISVVA
jgi:hypothetical protein